MNKDNIYFSQNNFHLYETYRTFAQNNAKCANLIRQKEHINKTCLNGLSHYYKTFI